MVDWLAGKRMKGTSSERTSLSTTVLGGTGVGGWVELGRTTLGSAGDSIDITSLADKRYYMVLQDIKASGAVSPRRRLNADTGSNYSARSSGNGSADATNTSISYFNSYTNYSTNYFMVEYLANYSSKEKLSISHLVNQNTAGAANAPAREEQVNKWANTSDPIDQFTAINTQAGDFATGSELVVLGWDPADSHTNNFWEELASVELSSAGDNISSGTIPARKYLWIQIWIKHDTALDITGLMRFNGDVGNNYASRYSVNGGADVPRTSKSWVDNDGGSQEARLMNIFIVNNQTSEKLIIGHNVNSSSSGSGNAPNRREYVSKWCNTSDQITQVDLPQLDLGDFTTGSTMKIWGAD